MENPVSFDKVQRDVESRPRGAGDRLGRIIDLQNKRPPAFNPDDLPDFVTRRADLERVRSDLATVIATIDAILGR